MNEPSYTGRTLGGRYTVNAQLGSGGWGAVYAATQNDLGRPVALKVLHTSVALSTDGIMRFEREARAAAALGHPNIAQVTDFQVLPGEPPFLVMELLTGRTLGSALSECIRMEPPRVAWIAYQMLAGLDVAHRAGIVHRDIKPDNVFLVSMPGVDDHEKLLDFGIAKLAADPNTSLTEKGTLLGSPAFMAPEQITSAPLDHRVDLYAVGATMYLALTGRMPFDATSMHALMLAITQEPLVPVHALYPSIDPGLSDVVARAMDRDPDGRFPSAEAMRQALEPFLVRPGHTPARVVSPMAAATLAPASAPLPLVPIAPAPPKGNGAVIGLLVAIVGLLLLLVGAGVVGYAMYAGRAPAPVVSASASAPAPAPAIASTPPASASASAVASAKGKPTVIDAGPPIKPAGGKEFGGAKVRVSGGTYTGYDIQACIAAVSRLGGALNGCYAATQFDPPDHQFTDWAVTVDASGNVTSARRQSDDGPLPKLDNCVIPILRQVKFPAKPGGGTMRVALDARSKG